MEALKNSINTFVTGQLVPLGGTVIVLALVVLGFSLIIGTRQMIDWAKNHIFHIIGGTVLIYLGMNIAQSFIESLGGTF